MSYHVYAHIRQTKWNKHRKRKHSRKEYTDIYKQKRKFNRQCILSSKSFNFVFHTFHGVGVT